MAQHAELSATYRRNAAAVWRRIDDTVIVLPPDAAQPVQLSDTAVSLWDLLTEPITVERAAARLATQYRTDVTVVTTDLVAAFVDLRNRGVLELVRDAGP